MSRYIGCSELSLLEKLLNKIVINQYTNCWEWQGGKNNIGYGMIRDGKKMRTAHRVSYEEHNNVKIPKNLVTMHSCDNPGCINPQHLSLGTRKQNTQDMLSKGRANIFGAGPKGINVPQLTCIHCNKTLSKQMYARYHGDKCKLKQVSINTL